MWEWLYSKENIALRDFKRELSIKITKAEQIGKEEYSEGKRLVGKSVKSKVIMLNFDSQSVYDISKICEYYNAVRSYLSMEKKDDFCKDMPECFPAIYFDERISSTVNSLHRGFEELREEIVQHLTVLNNYHAKFLRLLEEGKSNQAISQEFSMDTGIECSPQAGREDIQNLKLLLYNEITEQEEMVKCELHTKFNRFNIDREKQDRIYFFPGRPGIKEGKIIVRHIGKHL